jgi:hypothetical protein
MVRILPSRLFCIDNADPFVTHTSSFIDLRSNLIFNIKMLIDRPRVTKFDAITGFDPL